MNQAVTLETIAKADALQDKAARGRNADLLLSNPVFDEAFSMLRAALIDRLSNTPLTDTDGVVLVAQEIQVLDLVKRHFVSLVRAGKLADADLQAQREFLVREQERLAEQEKGFVIRGMRQAQRMINRDARAAARET